MITAADIRTRRSHANMVQDRLDRVLQLDTNQRRQEYEWAQEEFTKRHHCDWREWVDKTREHAR